MRSNSGTRLVASINFYATGALFLRTKKLIYNCQACRLCAGGRKKIIIIVIIIIIIIIIIIKIKIIIIIM